LRLLNLLYNYLQKHTTLAYLLAISWLALVVYTCCMPASTLPKVPIIPNADKAVHFCFYAVLTYLWYCANSNIKLLQYCIVSICIGIVIELIQKYFIPGRSFDVWDIVANSMGAFSIWLLKNKLFNF
jgi:VanZ family protein